jgi:hypothetical protein
MMSFTLTKIDDMYDIPTPTRITAWGLPTKSQKSFKISEPERVQKLIMQQKVPINIVMCDGTIQRHESILNAKKAYNVSYGTLVVLQKGGSTRHLDICAAYKDDEEMPQPIYTVYYNDGSVTMHANRESVSKYTGQNLNRIKEYLTGRRLSPLPGIDKIIRKEV